MALHHISNTYNYAVIRPFYHPQKHRKNIEHLWRKYCINIHCYEPKKEIASFPITREKVNCAGLLRRILVQLVPL